MKYLISQEGKSLAISTELANLAFLTPRESNVFGVITHPTNGFTSLVISDLYYEILVHPNADPNIFASLMGYDTPQDIINIINAVKIEQVPPAPPSGYELGRFAFNDVVEGYLTTHDNQYMVDNGWF